MSANEKTPIRILVADDHAVFRAGLKSLLEKESDLMVVGEAETGLDTIRSVAKTAVDVLVLDISMPGISGAQVAEDVLKKKPDLAIVVLTMHEDEYYLQEFLKIGARGFVLKKSTGAEVIQAIRAAYRGGQYIDSALAKLVIASYIGSPREPKKHRADLLTPREAEVCRLLAYGHTNAEIAAKLFISERTVETHRANLMTKLELKSRAELVRFAIDYGLLPVGKSTEGPCNRRPEK